MCIRDRAECIDAIVKLLWQSFDCKGHEKPLVCGKPLYHGLFKSGFGGLLDVYKRQVAFTNIGKEQLKKQNFGQDLPLSLIHISQQRRNKIFPKQCKHIQCTQIHCISFHVQIYLQVIVLNKSKKMPDKMIGFTQSSYCLLYTSRCV